MTFAIIGLYNILFSDRKCAEFATTIFQLLGSDTFYHIFNTFSSKATFS